MFAYEGAVSLSMALARNSTVMSTPADLAALLDHDVPVYYVADDARTRGIAPTAVIDGVQPVPADDLPSLFAGYEQVWLW